MPGSGLSDFTSWCCERCHTERHIPFCAPLSNNPSEGHRFRDREEVRGSSVAGLPSKACPLTRRQVRSRLPSNKSQDTSQLHIQRFSPPQKSPKEERLTQRPPRAGPHSTLSSNGTNTNAPHRLGAPIPEELTDLDCGTSPMVKAEHIYDTCPYANIIPVNTLQILQCQRPPASP